MEHSKSLGLFRLPQDAAPGLPEYFYFMDCDCRPVKTEREEFARVRAACKVSELEFGDIAARVLHKVVIEQTKSTAKSGSLMSFEGGLMAKSMNEEEAATLSHILPSYASYMQDPVNAAGDAHRGDLRQGSLLPRFYGAYVYVKQWGLTGILDNRTCFTITANVFAGVPQETLCQMPKFDLKGTMDDRAQRSANSEFMDFDLIKKDQKFVPSDIASGRAFFEQLDRDTSFLLQHHMPRGPVGLIAYNELPEWYRGECGMMDYSLLIGVAPRATPGGIVRVDVREETFDDVAQQCSNKGAVPGSSQTETAPAQHRIVQDKVLFCSIIDILQFWTPKKRLARRFKKALRMERDDDNEYHGEMLDTVRPSPYRERWLAFMREIFTQGSWLDSLPRLHGNDWGNVPQRQIHQLPAALRDHGEFLRVGRRSTCQFKPRRKKAKPGACSKASTFLGCSGQYATSSSEDGSMPPSSSSNSSDTSES